MSVGNYIAQAILSLYQHYELTIMCWNNGNKIAKKQSLGKSLRDFSWKGMKSGEPAFIDKNNKTTPKGGKGGIFKKPFLTRPLVSLMSEGQQMIKLMLYYWIKGAHEVLHEVNM